MVKHKLDSCSNYNYLAHRLLS